MSPVQRDIVVQALTDADLAFRLKGTSINRELKIQRLKHSGKVKRMLTALSKHPDTIDGVDWIFNQRNKSQ